jgi:hypothetical protein
VPRAHGDEPRALAARGSGKAEGPSSIAPAVATMWGQLRLVRRRPSARCRAGSRDRRRRSCRHASAPSAPTSPRGPCRSAREGPAAPTSCTTWS